MSYSLYIHLPFCKKKCPYCSFTSITGAEKVMEQYADAVALEIKRRKREVYGGIPATIYIGGGTPSLVSSGYIKNIVREFTHDIIGKNGTFHEFTVEANPESIKERWLDGVLGAGANRISIGIQSLDNGILSRLGRIHDVKQAVLSVSDSRRAGFENISVDLMFGVPGQTIEIWKRTVEGVLALKPEHISAYSLNVEEDTEYYWMMQNEGLFIPEPAETADMYILMCEMFEKEGLLRYEISNFARAGCECSHNQSYWNFSHYLGVGASAHSFYGNIRSWNENDPLQYMKRCFS